MAPEPVERDMIAVAAGRSGRTGAFDDALARLAVALAPAWGPSATSETVPGAREVRFGSIGALADAAGEGTLCAVRRAGGGGASLRLLATAQALLGLVGAKLGDPSMARPAATLTLIERRIAARVCDHVMDAFSAAVGMEVDAADGAPTPLVAMPPSAGLHDRHVAGVSVGLGDPASGPSLVLIAPTGAVGTLARRDEAGGALPTNARVSVGSSLAQLAAVVEAEPVRLSDMLAWRAGSSLALREDPSRAVAIECDGRTLFRAVAGHRRSGILSLRITATNEDATK